MKDEITKSGKAAADGPFGHGDYERQDLGPKNIVYFLLILLAITAVCMVGLKGLYVLLDHQVRQSQPALNPLAANVPKDSLHIPPGYPQSSFPSPRLEEDERGQLSDIRQAQDETLYSYGWVDEKNGAVRIPIERAMDLLVQRGLPVRRQEEANNQDDAGNDMAAPASAKAGKNGETK
jgi:hypothetical protein